MPLDDKLLELLCCPTTKVAVKLLPKDKLDKLNELIKQGQVKFEEGSPVENPVEQALITEDNKTIYLVESDIPIMLADKAVATDQLSDF